MKGRVTADQPSCELEQNSRDTAQISDEVHKVVDNSAVSNLVNLEPEILLSNHIFDSFWSRLECVRTIMEIIKKHIV